MIRPVLAACLGLCASALAGERPSATSAPAVVGLDHVPIAVADLETASARYRALGFTLKPGRPHDNGIRNHHAKFADGTELELITAPEARDALTTTYRRHLSQGDGPAFLALYAPVMEAAASRLRAAGIAFRQGGPFAYLAETDGLGHLFLGPRNRSPTDRAEHFAHANGATALVRVWLAGDLGAERRLLDALGARVSVEDVHVPDRARLPVARFPEGDLVLLPADRQLVPGRTIVGATLRVRALAMVQAALARGGVPAPLPVATSQGTSLFVPPAQARGLWIEFRESP
jgi:catechol 2,3-dioxygenase-like lactoylglutathione lyase family enzyme